MSRFTKILPFGISIHHFSGIFPLTIKDFANFIKKIKASKNNVKPICVVANKEIYKNIAPEEKSAESNTEEQPADATAEEGGAA